MLLPYRTTMPTIAKSAFVEESARIIGDVAVDEESSIWFQVVIRGDVNSVRIGKRTNIQDASVVHVSRETHPTVIGDEVTVGHQATLHGCTVHDGCLIGIGAILLDGVVVGEESLVAAGTIVAPGTVVPPRSLVMGTPGRPKRSLSDLEVGRLRQSAANYVALRLDYLRLAGAKTALY